MTTNVPNASFATALSLLSALVLLASCAAANHEGRKVGPTNPTPSVHDLARIPNGALMRVKVLHVQPRDFGTAERIVLEVVEIAWIGDGYPAPNRHVERWLELFGVDETVGRSMFTRRAPPVVGDKLYVENPYYSTRWVDKPRSWLEKNTEPWLNCSNGMLKPGAEYWVALKDIVRAEIVVLAEPAGPNGSSR